jgi:hypothetical protein
MLVYIDIILRCWQENNSKILKKIHVIILKIESLNKLLSNSFIIDFKDIITPNLDCNLVECNKLV